MSDNSQQHHPDGQNGPNKDESFSKKNLVLGFVSSILSWTQSFSNKNPGVIALLALIVALTSPAVTIWLKSVHERPEVKILGALPINVYTNINLGGINHRELRLAFIFKVENLSPTVALTHMAMIEGCVSLDPLIAD